MLPDQAGLGEVEAGNHGVGRLLVVGVKVLASAGADPRRGVEPENPAGHVQGVDAVVAQLAGAVVPVPVPVVVEPVGVERPLGRRAEPEVVIHSPGRWTVFLVANRLAVAGDPGAGERRLAELARAD